MPSDKTNNLESCICPPRHRGLFCDECAAQGPHVLAFPNCSVEEVPLQAKLSRVRTNQLLFRRLLIIFLACGLLCLLGLVMCVRRWGERRSAKLDSGTPTGNGAISEVVSERQIMLQNIFSDSDRRKRWVQATVPSLYPNPHFSSSRQSQSEQDRPSRPLL